MESLDYLFNWLFSSDEPQTYIYGKGGSGKTSIAHEFATILKKYGAGLRIYGSQPIDLVIFLSAKERSFLPSDHSVVDLTEPDFDGELSLLVKILLYSGLYTVDDKLSELNLARVKEKIIELFDEFSCVVVLDDIDTLTTKNVEVGTNFLYRTLARAKKTSRMICTQRNIPTHAIGASMEVPGLSPSDEFEEFVRECVRQYAVQEPDETEKARLAELSERRPLVVEYLVALRRSCPNFKGVFRLFEGDTGNDIRDYVFKREWTSLAYGPDSRSVLATLSVLNRSASFNDLAAILEFGEGRLRDAISAVRAMFLQVNDAGSETLYGLDVLTRAFVVRESETIDRIGVIKARVKAFEKEYFPDVPQVSRLAFKSNDLIRRAISSFDVSKYQEAWDLVNDPKLSHGIVEHPQFKSLLGYVACKIVPPRLDAARSAFGFVMSTRYDPPIEHVRAWFDAERNSGIGFANCMSICDFVSKSRQYNRQDKIDFLSLKATSMYHRGREQEADNPTDAVILLTASIKTHSVVYKYNRDSRKVRAETSEEYIRNTTFFWLQLCVRSMGLDQVVNQCYGVLSSDNGYLDPIEEPIREELRRVKVVGYEASVLHKSKREIARILGMPQNDAVWIDDSCLGRIKANFTELEGRITTTLNLRSRDSRR